MTHGSKKILFFLLLLVGVVTAGYVYEIGPTRQYIDEIIFETSNLDKTLLNNKSVALREARNVFEETVSREDEINPGCLREELVPGWSFAVVENKASKENVNQSLTCENFLNGITHSIIEYDTFGNYVGIRGQSR